MSGVDPSPGSPAPPAPSTRSSSIPPGLWRALKILAAVVYLLAATLLSLLGAALVPRIGPSIGAHLPEKSVLVLHLKDGNETWAALERHASVRALWDDPQFQQHTRFREKWEKTLEEWHAKGNERLFHLDRQGLAFAVGGELAVAVQPKPPGWSEEQGAPAVIFARVQGARGGILRALLWLVARTQRSETQKERPQLLGGDLVALKVNGGAPARPGDAFVRPPCPEHATAFVHAQGELLKAAPQFWELSGVTVPEKIQLWFEPTGGGGVHITGNWHGSLPSLSAPGALPAPELPEGATPILDLQTPLDARAAFLKWVDGETSKGGKKAVRWQARMGRLAEAGVDLNRDLWPYVGPTFRFQIVPPAEGSVADQALVLASWAFKERAVGLSQPPLATLYQFGRAYAEQFYEHSAPSGAERPYLVHLPTEEGSRMVWVRGSVLRPTFYLSREGFAFLSDAGPMALTPAAPRLDANERQAPACALRLQVDGERLAPHVSALAGMELEDQRDEMGAAEFLKKVPDERAVIAFAAKLSRLVGHLQVEVKANSDIEGKRPAAICVDWQPQLR